jgi:hypothetical protein
VDFSAQKTKKTWRTGTGQFNLEMYHAATHQTLAILTGWNFMSTAFFHHAQNIY